MRTFRKYSFGSQGAATTKINALGLDDEGAPTHNHSIVILGNIVETPAEYDDEFNVVTPAVLSSTYHVDVLWDGDPDPSWDNQMVWCPPMGLHTFGSSSAIAEWTRKCRELHPEYFPQPEDDIEGVD